MTARTLIPTFVFWAFLTIITPTLILLSENSNADLDFNGNNITESMRVRRMIGHTQNYVIRTPPAAAKLSVVEEELASAPAPAPLPHSHDHNRTRKSNSTNYGLTLSSSKAQVQLNQTNVTYTTST